MEEIMKDSRFSHIAHDPRFKRIPKQEKKIKIDKRFQSMFSDKKFKVTYTVDKRGRPITHTSSEDLKKYYALSSAEDEDSESESGKNVNSDDSDETNKPLKSTQTSSVKVEHGGAGEDGSTSGSFDEIKTTDKIIKHNESFRGSNSNSLKRKKVQQKLESGSEVSTDNEVSSKEESKGKEILANNIKEKLRDLTVDYARGEGILLSDSSSDEESSEAGSEDEELDHGWGELDHDAERTDEVTNRLALCHMDWDQIRASDLMILFNSFLPQGGLIHSVMIYPSEFGLKRMKEEELKGPLELLDEGNSVRNIKEEEDGEENEEGSKYHMEKLRQYQLNRLKYYYAILVCDSPGTANKIYTDCDGLEYESSATRLDLRFVPNDIIFNEEPREVCDKLPDLSKYNPRFFTTTALQQAKVELTWDEANPERDEIIQKLNSGEVDGISEMDLHNYLAFSSEEESDAAPEGPEETNGTVNDRVSKYRNLLREIEEQEEKKKFRDVEMEVSWGVGLKDKTEELVQKKLKEKNDDLTPFEQYLEKRKEKKKQKKEERIKKNQQTSEASGNEYSDDDIPSDIDLNDQYFKEEFEGEFKKKKKNNKNKTNKVYSLEDKETKHEEAELELLMMNDDTEKNHFSLTSIQEKEAECKKKRKKKGKTKLIKQESRKDDDFEVNVKDERFSALFSSHHFNLDPTDSHYRKTKGMEALRTEKLHRRQIGMNDEPNGSPAKIQKMDTVCGKDSELSLLVKTVKRKTQSLHKGAR